jgi:glycosyltransferase involved in cell wall biosynthesis
MNRNDNAPFHRYLQNTIAGANAEDRVIFTGPVSNVEDYLRAADLFVFPSRREGMPNVVPEAMACALPVVSTPFIGLPAEFGDPGTHYVLSSWDPVELAGDVGRLLVNADKRYILGRNARYWVEQNLDVNQSLDRYTALYGELADRSHLKK